MNTLSQAIKSQNLAKVFELIKTASNWAVGPKEDPPLIAAVLTRNQEIVEAILSANPPLGDKEPDFGMTALHVAAQENLLPIVKLLVAAGADVNAPDKFGNTPLSRAGGNKDVGLFLIESGSDPFAENKSGISPANCPAIAYNYIREKLKILDPVPASRNLEEASTLGDLIGLKYFINKGANVNEQFEEGKTALHILAESDSLEGIKILIEAGAEIDSMDDYGGTPLMLAAAMGNLEVVKELIDKGANKNAVDNFGNTVESMAKNHKSVQSFLKSIP